MRAKIRIPASVLAPLGALLILACGPAPAPRNSPPPPAGASRAAPDPGEPADGDFAAAPPGGERASAPADPGRAAGGLRTWQHRPRWTSRSFAGQKAYEDAIVRHVNALRRSLGLATLTPDPRLHVGARQHTVEMIQKRYYSHTSPVAAWKSPHQRACYAGYLEPFVSENIGMISGYPDVALAMFESWKKSPGHYRNMVDPRVSRIGVGLASANRGGMTIWIGTQLFGAAPLDLRNLVVREERRQVVRVTVTLKTTGGLEVKAWQGRQFAGDVPAAGNTHVFQVDLPTPMGSARRYGFAVKVGQQTPLVCAQAQVGAGGAATSSRVTYHPLCRRILDIRATTRTLTVTRRVLSGEARASTADVARTTRFFLNKVWGPRIPLQQGRWVAFSRALPGTPQVGLSLVLGKHQKDYLTLDFSRADPYVCP